LAVKAYLSYSTNGYHGINNVSGMVRDCTYIAVRLAKQWFEEVVLVADESGARAMADIPFDRVETALEGKIPRYLEKVWSLPKIEAYLHIAKKGDPFVHIDGDVFLWGALPERLLKAEVFAQSIEPKAHILYGVDTFLKACPNPGEIKNYRQPHAYNTGLFGGSNLALICEYAEEALGIIKNTHNEGYWKNVSWADAWKAAVIPEQYCLASILGKRGANIELLTDKPWPTDEQMKGVPYSHLMGRKQEPEIQKQVRELVKLFKSQPSTSQP
jgi:hypothetical protein